MPDPAELYAEQIQRGLAGLDGDTLTGIIVDDTYVFDADHDTDTAVETAEVAGAGYTRPTSTARVERTAGADAWKLFLDDITPTDLSAVTNRGGIAWVTDTGLTVVYADDPGGAVDPYEPTWDDGIVELPIESVAGRLAAAEAALAAQILTDHADVDVTTAQTDGQALLWHEASDTWKPGAVGGGGGGGATDDVSIDLSGETPGAIDLDLSAVADSVAAATVIAPDGGDSTFTVLTSGLPGATRGHLGLTIYCPDSTPRTMTLDFPEFGTSFTAEGLVACELHPFGATMAPASPGAGSGGPAISDADPQPLGTADPGSTGEAADAGHVHEMPTAADVGAAAATHASTHLAGGSDPLATIQSGFGTGADGNVTIASDTTVTSDANAGFKQYQNLTVNSGVTLTVNGIVYVSGTLTNNGTISAKGNNAATTVGGTATGGVFNNVQATNQGGNGAAVGLPSSNPTGGQMVIGGGRGGTGGDGNAGAISGLAAGLSPTMGTGQSEAGWRTQLSALLVGMVFIRNSSPAQVSGAGTGGGGGASSGSTGGGGGGGGGFLFLVARHVAGAGTITANGGNGASPTGGNAGGGGGGGGGFVGLRTGSSSHGFTITTAGGTGAAGFGTGGTGVNGSAGNSAIILGAT